MILAASVYMYVVRVRIRAEPNMLKVLPTIPSCTSQNFDLLFLFYSHIITYRIRQNIRGGKLSRFINNVHYVGKTFAVCSLKAHARLCNTDFRVCAN